MMGKKKAYLISLINGFLSSQENVQWLLRHGIRAQKIANFGCAHGFETLALICEFGAAEAFGIDIAEDCIREAKDLCSMIKEEIRLLWFEIQTQQENEDLKELWELIPQFFKREIFHEKFQLEFEKGDIAYPTRLRQDRYHLVFCRKVLHHIWYDQNRENPQGDTQSAVNEMARIVRPGGIVASFSIIQFEDKPNVDFGELYKKARLKLVYREEVKTGSYQRDALAEKYIFQKPKPAK